MAAAALLVSACAPRGPAKSASGDGADDDGPAQETKKKKRPTRSLEENRQEFMRVCTKTPDMEPYCECGWGVMTKMFTAEEMSSDDVNDVRMAKLKGAVTKQCASKMPEPMLRDAFVKGCGKDDAALGPYCGCMWSELRKTFSGGDLAQSEIVKSPRFTAAVGVGAKACTPKISEATVRRAFFEGCNKDPGYESFCACAWKDLRGRATLGEIQSASESPEMKETLREVAGRCRKHLPRAQ